MQITPETYLNECDCVVAPQHGHFLDVTVQRNATTSSSTIMLQVGTRILCEGKKAALGGPCTIQLIKKTFLDPSKALVFTARDASKACADDEFENAVVFECKARFLAPNGIDSEPPIIMLENCNPQKEVHHLVWDVRYDADGTVCLRSMAKPNYWLERDPTGYALHLVPTERRSKWGKFRVLCV